MPTYEYRCRDCGEHLEVVQSFTDEALTTCPACSGDLRKVFGNIGIVFKGSGFYKTDSRGSTAAASKTGESTGNEKGAGEKTTTSTTDTAADKSSAPSAGAPSSGSGSGSSATTSSPSSGSSTAATAAAAS